MRIKILGRVREIPDYVPVLLLDAVVFAVLFYLVNHYYAGTPYYSTLLALVIFVALLIPFLYAYNNYRKIREREKYFPQFLKDIADVYRSGMSLVQAIYQVSKQNYGELTPQIKKLAVRLSWGVPFEEAFRLFAKETGSPLIEGATLIILEAFSSGGNVADVLETVAEDIRRLRTLQEERRSRFSPFIGTMYTVFLISIGLSYVLLNVLLPEMPVLPSLSLSFTPGGTASGAASIPEYSLKVIFLHLLLIQALVSGLLAGIVGEGSWTAGLKHALIMGFIALIAFHLFILPVDPAERLAGTIAKLPTTLTMSVDLGRYYVEKNITVDEIREIIASRGNVFARNTDVDIRFEADPQCEACGSLVEVNAEGVFIREPLYLSFRVMSNGDGSVTISVR
ncbi:MAG: hypothetical protein GXO00_02800 [Candidatus Diapherotrites archaeon]|nr:hypothetical protein [Candidatus Diapherotrites archaeon]